MKINNNISAVISNKHLLRNEGYLSISMEKLSSGYKINHSGDDPSGMAISSKMRAQIRGLDQASQNASDGMSVLETADGALNEVTDMIQRMRELSVQSANGTNSESDRKAIQDEIDQLVQEIDRVSETTEFNTKKLLDGSLDKRVYTDGISRVTLSDEVPAGNYDFSIDIPPTQASLESTTTWQGLADYMNQTNSDGDYIYGESFINFNGTGVTIRPGMTAENMYTLFRQAAELGETEVSDFEDGQGLVEFRSIAYGDEASLSIQMDATLADALDFTFDDKRNAYDPVTNTGGDTSYVEYTPGTNAVITLDKENSDFGKQATTTTLVKESSVSASRSVDGRRIRFTDVGGFQIDFLIDEDLIDEMNETVATEKAQIKTLRVGISDQKTIINNLKKERATIESEIEDLEDEVESAKTAVETLTAQKEQLEASIADLDSQIADLESSSSLSAEESAKLAELKAERDEKNTTLTETEKAIAEKNATIKEDEVTIAYKKDSTSLGTSIISLQADLATAQTSGDTAEEARLTAEITYLQDIQTKLSGQRGLNDVDTDIAAAQTIIDNNQTQIDTLNATIQDKWKSPDSNKDLDIEVTDIGPMNLQIGANEGQQMSVRIDSTSAKKLYLDQVDVSTQRGATRALEQLDESLAMISNTRSTIGAYTNRLEHAVNSLNQTSENMNQAISRIQDVDIATEMTEYTKYNVLQQAATSALSQANELPQTALQLLQ